MGVCVITNLARAFVYSKTCPISRYVQFVTNSLASQKYVEVLNVPTFHCVKCPYSELFSSAFSRIRTKHGDILRVSPYSVRMRQNADQNNSEYGNVLRSLNVLFRQSKFGFSKIFFSGVVSVLYFFFFEYNFVYSLHFGV